jgi:hypothetical protein
MFDWLDDVLNVSGDARLAREENKIDSPTPFRILIDAALMRDFDAAMEVFAEDCVLVMEPDMETGRGKKVCLGLVTRGALAFDRSIPIDIGSDIQQHDWDARSLSTARRIVDGDLESWTFAWTETAQRIEDIAQKSLGGGSSSANARRSSELRSIGKLAASTSMPRTRVSSKCTNGTASAFGKPPHCLSRKSSRSTFPMKTGKRCRGISCAHLVAARTQPL